MSLIDFSRRMFTDNDCTEYAKLQVLIDKKHSPAATARLMTPAQRELSTRMMDIDESLRWGMHLMLLARRLVQWTKFHGHLPRPQSADAEERTLAQFRRERANDV